MVGVGTMIDNWRQYDCFSFFLPFLTSWSLDSFTWASIFWGRAGTSKIPKKVRKPRFRFTVSHWYSCTACSKIVFDFVCWLNTLTSRVNDFSRLCHPGTPHSQDHQNLSSSKTKGVTFYRVGQVCKTVPQSYGQHPILCYSVHSPSFYSLLIQWFSLSSHYWWWEKSLDKRGGRSPYSVFDDQTWGVVLAEGRWPVKYSCPVLGSWVVTSYVCKCLFPVYLETVAVIDL